MLVSKHIFAVWMMFSSGGQTWPPVILRTLQLAAQESDFELRDIFLPPDGVQL